MKRPLEQDYTSLTAYTRALEEYCNGLNMITLEGTPITEEYWNKAITAIKEALAQPKQEPEIDGATMAGMNASIGHLSTLVDELRLLLGCAMNNFKMLHNAAKPDDGPDMDTIIPANVFSKFVNQDAALRYAIKQSAHDGMIPAPPAAQPEQEPYSVQQAYAMAQVCLDLHEALGCKWGDNVYLTISQLKAAHGIKENKHD